MNSSTDRVVSENGKLKQETEAELEAVEPNSSPPSDRMLGTVVLSHPLSISAPSLDSRLGVCLLLAPRSP